MSCARVGCDEAGTEERKKIGSKKAQRAHKKTEENRGLKAEDRASHGKAPIPSAVVLWT
jgi:hypothetical protein